MAGELARCVNKVRETAASRSSDSVAALPTARHPFDRTRRRSKAPTTFEPDHRRHRDGGRDRCSRRKDFQEQRQRVRRAPVCGLSGVAHKPDRDRRFVTPRPSLVCHQMHARAIGRELRAR